MKAMTLAGIAVAVVAAAVFSASWLQAQREEPAAPAPAQNLFPFIRSLDGTATDGNLREDAGDRLVISAELPLLFEYFLSAIGEKPLGDIRREIERELDVRLKPRAALEAKDLLGRYLAYKRALAEVDADAQIAGTSLDAVRGRLVAMLQTRARFFSAAEAEAMFALEDAQHRDAVARLEVSLDKSLSDGQKAQRYAALDAALPPELKEARDASLQIVRLEESANSMRKQGASEDDVYRMRAAALSPEAAARMAQVDREEVEWQQRVAAYLGERKRLQENTANQLPAEREAALQQLRQGWFTEDEQRRLAAYE